MDPTSRVRHLRHGLAWLIIGCAAAGAVPAIQAAGPNVGHHHGANPFEPTVTREESARLGTAMEIASTNTLAAIRLLQEGDLSEASPALDFAVGNLYFQSDRLGQAAAAYRRALEKLPAFRSARVNLGRVYLLQEKTAEAIALYQELVSHGQADADTLQLLGHALLMENYPVSAESAYRQCLLLRPKDDDAMLGLAKALMQQTRYAEGLALVEEILRMDPTNRELWSLRSNASLSVGDYAAAARSIEQAHRLGSADAEMLASLGDLYINRDQPEDALRAYLEAFRSQAPSLQRMLRALEGFVMTGSDDGAQRMIEEIESVRRRSPDGFAPRRHARLLRLQGELAQQRGHPADAIDYYQEALGLDPLDGTTLLLLAELLQQEGRLEEAVMACERAARIKGYEANALVRQAQIEVRRERYAQAAALLEAAQTFRDQPHVGRYLEQVRRMVD